jgi:5-formyltetrahydrofolate cyclo-ligase
MKGLEILDQSPIFTQKNELRRQYASLRRSLSIDERKIKSAQIRERLFNLSVWQTSSHIALYYSIREEVNTIPIIHRGWQEDKTIYLPKSDPDHRQLLFYQVSAINQLIKGAYGIPEPTGFERMLKLEQLECILVPGLLFDINGYRLGYGGGYYDRLLPQLPEKTIKVGLAYHCQLYPSPMPRDRCDQPVDLVITEEQVIYFTDR